MAAIAPARIALAWRTGPRARPGLPRRMPAASVPPEGKGKGTRGTGRVRHRYHQVAGAGPRRRTRAAGRRVRRSEEHTSELQSVMRISYAVFCLKKKKD